MDLIDCGILMEELRMSFVLEYLLSTYLIYRLEFGSRGIMTSAGVGSSC